MDYSVDFKKNDREFLNHSAIAQFIRESIEKTPMYKHALDKPERKANYDITITALLETAIKHNLPLSAVNHLDIGYFITNENSQEVINVFKSIGNKAKEERTAEELSFLRDVHAVIGRITLILLKFFLNQNNRKGTRSRDLLGELREEYREYKKR